MIVEVTGLVLISTATQACLGALVCWFLFLLTVNIKAVSIRYLKDLVVNGLRRGSKKVNHHKCHFVVLFSVMIPAPV